MCWLKSDRRPSIQTRIGDDFCVLIKRETRGKRESVKKRRVGRPRVGRGAGGRRRGGGRPDGLPGGPDRRLDRTYTPYEGHNLNTCNNRKLGAFDRKFRDSLSLLCCYFDMY